MAAEAGQQMQILNCVHQTAAAGLQRLLKTVHTYLNKSFTLSKQILVKNNLIHTLKQIYPSFYS